MKKIISSFIISAAAVLSLVSCVEEPFSPIEDMLFDRVLTPTDLVASVTSAGDVVSFDWSKAKGATEFELEIATDSTFATPGELVTVLPEQLPYSHKLVADETYFYRVRGIDSEQVLEASNWAVAKDPDTGYMLQIETYAIKPSVNPLVASRTANSVSLTWTPVSKEDNEVTHILVETPGENDVEFPVPAANAATGIEVTGLAPSTMYTLTVHFKSANRGSVIAWTRPSAEGFTAVADTAAFKQALKDGAAKIKVAYSDVPYVMGGMNITGAVAIVGESSESGEKPVIAGSFTTTDGIASIRLEDLTLSGAAVKANADGTGGMDLQGHVVTISGACKLGDVEFINVNIDTYQKGIYYDNKGAELTGHFLMDGVRVDNILGSGGDCIDARTADSAIPEFVIRNSTFNGGCRSFVRLDAKVRLGSVLVENNTFNNMCYDGSALVIGGSNVQGIFAVKSESLTKFEVKNNLFLNNQCWLIGSNSACQIPVFANNYYYNCVDQFFTSAKLDGSGARTDMDMTLALADGGIVLGDDPCEDSMGTIFNVSEPSVIKANVGDPRWYIPYVEVPEDLTQGITEAIHTWDFTDSKTFYKGADKDMVRDGIRFYVQSTPVMFNEGLEFTGASSVVNGVPVDGALGIKVNQDGSLIISTVASELAGEHSHLTVSLDGKVSASVPVGAEYQKVTFTGIEGQEHMIYITACNPIVLNFLQWSNDVEVLDTVLDTPVVKLSKTTVNERAEDEITLTWDPVDYAASYNVTVDGKTKNVTETTYSFSTANYAVEEEGGDFAITVTAVPSPDDYTREESVPAELTFHVNDVPIVDTGEIVDPSAITETYYAELNEAGGFAAQKFEDGTGAVTIGKLTFGDKAELDGNRYKHGGGSSVTDGIPSNRYVSFKITRAGTVSHKTISGSSSDAEREYVVALVTNIGGVKSVRELYRGYAPTDSATEPLTSEVTQDMLAGITEAAVVYIYTVKNCNTYAVGYDPVPAAPAKVDKLWDFSSDVWIAAMEGSGIAANTNDSNWNLEVDGLKVVSGGGSIKWNVSGDYHFWQPGGKSDGTNRYFEFTTDVAGKLTVYVSNTGSSEDLTRMATVQVGDAEPESVAGGYSSSDGPHAVDFNVSAGTVKVYPTGNALRFYKIEFHSN